VSKLVSLIEHDYEERWLACADWLLGAARVCQDVTRRAADGRAPTFALALSRDKLLQAGHHMLGVEEEHRDLLPDRTGWQLPVTWALPVAQHDLVVAVRHLLRVPDLGLSADDAERWARTYWHELFGRAVPVAAAGPGECWRCQGALGDNPLWLSCPACGAGVLRD
jgi:hypothetical protein